MDIEITKIWRVLWIESEQQLVLLSIDDPSTLRMSFPIVHIEGRNRTLIDEAGHSYHLRCGAGDDKNGPRASKMTELLTIFHQEWAGDDLTEEISRLMPQGDEIAH